jgi:hypothetical protein
MESKKRKTGYLIRNCSNCGKTLIDLTYYNHHLTMVEGDMPVPCLGCRIGTCTFYEEYEGDDIDKILTGVNYKNNEEQSKPILTLEELEKFSLDKRCVWCHTTLENSKMVHYDHSGGLRIKGFKDKQWVYYVCPNPKCQYQNAWHKLGRL